MPSFRGRPRIPEHGIKATLCGGNTIGGTIREREARADGYRHIDTPALVRRLVETDRAFVDVGVDNIETVGLHVVDPGFEEPGTWQVRSEGSMVATIDVFAADRPHRILSTLRDVFAGDGRP